MNTSAVWLISMWPSRKAVRHDAGARDAILRPVRVSEGDGAQQTHTGCLVRGLRYCHCRAESKKRRAYQRGSSAQGIRHKRARKGRQETSGHVSSQAPGRIGS